MFALFSVLSHILRFAYIRSIVNILYSSGCLDTTSLASIHAFSKTDHYWKLIVVQSMSQYVPFATALVVIWLGVLAFLRPRM